MALKQAILMGSSAGSGVSHMRLPALYALLAAVATAANIGAQDLLLRLYQGPWHVAASVVLGTGVGLVLKYVLDKRFIFRFRARNAAHDAQTFVLYVGAGVLTTALFWGTEWSFDRCFGGDRLMRYVGAVLGLAAGYWLKYHLDKRYVFRVAASGAQP